MRALWLAAFSALVNGSWCGDLDFPPGFKFGVATAAYQVEGAWNVSDKSENIWDHFTHTHPDAILNRDNGDVACDSYHRWREDVELVKSIGSQFYRFSIAWTRLLPSGFDNKISEDGASYYSNLIDELLKNGIEPVITLYHWDLPQSLQELGGWVNPLVSDWFADFARVAFDLYADRVKTWITINEPLAICDTYNYFGVAPGIVDPDRSSYHCTKYVLLAHAKAWRIYDEEFKPKFHGQVSIANHLMWYEAATPEDEEITEIVRQYGIGRFNHAIYSKEGGWPPAVEKIVAENSQKQGYTRSRMPAFTQEEIDLIKGTYDFFGYNHYMSRMVRKANPGEEITPWPLWGCPELNVVLENKADWGTASSDLFTVNPSGLRSLTLWLREQYGDPGFLITENGYGSTDYGLDDPERIQFLHDFMNQVLLLNKEDGVNMTGFTAWTLIDNFEWTDGYATKFGLHQVDFTDPLRTRTPRRSASYYRRVVEAHSLDVALD